MRTYSTTEIIKILKEKQISIFSLADFSRLFNIDNNNTLYKKIARLEKKKLIKKLTADISSLCILKRPSLWDVEYFMRDITS